MQTGEKDEIIAQKQNIHIQGNLSIIGAACGKWPDANASLVFEQS